jgi:hypothetical protein
MVLLLPLDNFMLFRVLPDNLLTPGFGIRNRFYMPTLFDIAIVELNPAQAG